MRGWRSVVLAVVATALVASPLQMAAAAGDGNPVIESPSGTEKHYSGYNGPFVVNLENAPFDTTYDYFVETDPAGDESPVLVGTKKTYTYDAAQTFPKPELRVSSLSPGAYRFRVTDNAGHESSLQFAVVSGRPPTCSIVLPKRVRMKARSIKVRARLSNSCSALRTTYAAWEARHPTAGFAQTFIFDNTTRDAWRIFDDEPTGVYTVRPNSAKSSSNETLPQNTARVVMRMDSQIRLTVKRSGAVVSLRTKSTRYSSRANRFVVWKGRKVILSYRTCPTCAWKRLQARRTDRSGVSRYRFTSTRARQYRATAAGTSTTWAPRAAYIRR